MNSSTITQRIDRITEIPQAFMQPTAPVPRSVKIELTATCNYHCAFCVKALRADVGAMDRALYSRIIRELRAAGVDELGVFYIGESFTCKWLPDAIAEAKDVGFPYVFLTTNGSVAHPDRVEACMRAGLDSLKFSINFADAPQLKAVAKVPERLWDRALDNLRAARERRDAGWYACGIYASSIAFDGEQGDRMRSIVEARVLPYADEHYWLPLYGMNGAAKAAGWKPSPGNPGRLAAQRPSLPCWAVFTEGHITKDGLLAACCFGDGIDGGLIMADLKKVSFQEGWNSTAYQALRAAHLARDVRGTGCEGCMAS